MEIHDRPKLSSPNTLINKVYFSGVSIILWNLKRTLQLLYSWLRRHVLRYTGTIVPKKSAVPSPRQKGNNAKFYYISIMRTLLNIPHLRIFLYVSFCSTLSKYLSPTGILYKRMSFPDISMKSDEIWQDVACCKTILSKIKRQEKVDRIYLGIKKLPVSQNVPLIQFRFAQGLDVNLKQFKIIDWDEHYISSFVTAKLIRIFFIFLFFAACFVMTSIYWGRQHNNEAHWFSF
jgi:hypothetical protein